MFGLPFPKQRNGNGLYRVKHIQHPALGNDRTGSAASGSLSKALKHVSGPITPGSSGFVAGVGGVSTRGFEFQERNDQAQPQPARQSASLKFSRLGSLFEVGLKESQEKKHVFCICLGPI